jgi:hypothetical protein
MLYNNVLMNNDTNKSNMAPSTAARERRRVDRVASAAVHPVVFGSAHLRMLIVMAGVMLASWFVSGILSNRCDEKSSTDFDTRRIVSTFHNELAAGAREDTLYLRSITCRNSSTATAFSAVVTYNLTTVTAPIGVTWYERGPFACLQNEKNGREMIRYQLIFLGVLAAIAVLGMVSALGARHKETSGHVKISGFQTVAFAFSMLLLLYALATIQDSLYYEKAEESKRDVHEGHKHITMAAWVCAIFGVVYGTAYFVFVLASAGLITNTSVINLAKEVSKSSPLQTETEYDKTFTPTKPQPRMIRTDGMWAIARHECLFLMTLFAVLAIALFASENVHSGAPGTYLNQTVYGFGMVSENSTSITCEPHLPFTMVVDMHNELLSTQHQMKYHMKDKGSASLAILIIVIFIGVAEACWSAYLYWQTNSLVQPSTGDGIYDIFTSVVPLISHTVSTLFSAVPVAVTGLILFYDFQENSKHHHLHKLADMSMANAAFTTISFFVHFALFVAYLVQGGIGLSKWSTSS